MTNDEFDGYVNYYQQMIQSTTIKDLLKKGEKPPVFEPKRRESDEPLIPTRDVLQLQKWFDR